AQVGDLLLQPAHLAQGGLRRVVLAVGPEAQRDQAEEGEDIEHGAHQRRPLRLNVGRPRSAGGMDLAGASVRMPTRSLALRARGLAAVSASPGPMALRVAMVKRAVSGAVAGA